MPRTSLPRTALALMALSLGSIYACASSESPSDDGQGGAGTVSSTASSGTSTTSSGTGAGGGGDAQVVVCGDAPSGTPGECTVTPGSADGRTFVVGNVLQPGRVYENGGVLIEKDGTISCVGCDCAAVASDAAQVLCPGASVSPGLINAHDHVGWMNGAPWVAAENGVDPALRWEHRHDWRKGKHGHPTVNVAGGSASKAEKTFGELRFLLGGATATFGSGDLGGLMRDFDATGSGSNGLGQPGSGYETFPLGDSSGTQLESDCGGYSPKAAPPPEVECYVPHVAEGIDAAARNEFLCLTGTGASAVDVLDERSTIIHGVGLLPADVEKMAQKGMRLVWSPRSNVSLYGDTAMVTMFHTMGVAIGLGTDWLPSGSMNVLRELACASSLNDHQFGGYFSDEDLWMMVTLGAARALGMDDAVGLLGPGHAGDVAIFRNQGESHYGAVVRADVDDVMLVLRGGEVMSGDANVVAALESGCDTLDVCGVAKALCVSRDTGTTLAEVEAAANPAYPLFFCGTPEDEPTCLPARTLAEDSVSGSMLYSGMTMAGDADSDGVADASDNCPTVFNPARPLDGAKQGDADSDGAGDACDPCPLAMGASCAVPDPYDVDGDGLASYVDNCASVSNADQADADGDFKGDACDPCPTEANPGAQKCPADPTTIYALQDATDPLHPAAGTPVNVSCVVTAVASKMFWCQDPKGGPYSGIAVYVNAKPTYDGTKPVLVGDSVTIDADYVEYQGVSELEQPTVTYVGAGTVPAAAVVAAADLATGGAQAEAYEGVFVRVNNVTVTNANPDAPSDYDEIAVTGGLRVDDLVMDAGGTGGAFDNASYTVGAAFASLTGVMHFSFSNTKLAPRSAADIVQ